jgi:hypothetical protein
MTTHAIMHKTRSDDEYEHYHAHSQDNDNTDEPMKKRSKHPRYFPSNKQQSFIKNAATGVAYPYKVGSNEQLMLYKIVDATGTCDEHGYVLKSRSDLPNPNTNHLFFDSPEQCMRHMRLTLNPEDVKRWHEKQVIAI